MLERSDLYDDRLVAKLAASPILGPPTLFPQRGIHTSRRRGASLEFSEHTEYVPGDDIKSLDWKVYAKSDRYFIRRYEDERLQRSVILVDGSQSMAYGGKEDSLVDSKYHLAARIAVSFAAALLRQGDSVGLALTGEEGLFIPPKAGMGQLDTIVEILAKATPSGQADLGIRAADIGERAGAPSSLYVVSDFIDEEVEELSDFLLLRARKIALRLIHVMHHDEVELPFDRTTRFLDIEGSAELVLDPDGVRDAYFAEIKKFVEGLSKRAHTAGIPYAFIRDQKEALEELPSLLAGTRGR